MAIRRARPMSTMYRYYDPATGETLHIDAPLYMKEDFQKKALTQDGSLDWLFAQVSAAGGDGTGAIKANLAGGIYELDLVSTESEAASSFLYFSDQLLWDVTKGVIFEVKYRFTDVPATTTEVVLGLAGAEAVDFDAITDNAWFRHEANDEVVLETDDALTDTDDTATGVHLDADEWVIGRIELIDPTVTRFYLNGVRKGASVAHRMSAAAANMQPFFGISRTAGTALATLEIDYVLIAQGAR